MGSVNFRTTIAHWYEHQAESQKKALATFRKELELHAAQMAEIDARIEAGDRSQELADLYKRTGGVDLSYCFIPPQELMNDYSMALWLPSGSKNGWGTDLLHRELALRFRDLALESGASVLVAWDYDFGEAHGHEYFRCRDDFDDSRRSGRTECTEKTCANFHGWRAGVEGENAALYRHRIALQQIRRLLRFEEPEAARKALERAEESLEGVANTENAERAELARLKQKYEGYADPPR